MSPPTLIRPATMDNIRLFHRQKPKFNPEKFDLHGLNNITIMIRLYKSFSAMPIMRTMVEKDALMTELFSDQRTISKCQVGRILESVVQYRLSFQKNSRRPDGSINRMYWRWTHPLEIVYGLECFMIQTWLCDWIKLNGEKVTIEVIEDELEVLRDMDNSEEKELFEVMEDKGLFRARRR